MAKPKLKLVEPSLEEQLDGAIALAARLRQAHNEAAQEFRNSHPEDRRLIEGNLAGTVLADGSTDPHHPNAVHEPKQISYRRDGEKLSDLGHQVREADRAIDLLRARIEAAITEDERRTALAAAIAELRQTDEALQKLRGTVNRADSAVADAQERHADAAKAVTAASEAHARLFEAAIEQGHPPAPDSNVRDARRAVDDAADELGVAKSAAAAMRAKLGHAEQRVSDARSVVIICAGNVATSAIPRLLEEAQAMQRDLEARRQVLSVLSDHDNSGAGFGAAVNDYLSSSIFPFEQAYEASANHPAAEPWLALIDHLVCDADAPLPAN